MLLRPEACDGHEIIAARRRDPAHLVEEVLESNNADRREDVETPEASPGA
jgi:hypothetical protein